MVSYRQGNSWSTPEILPFTKEQVNYSHPTLSEDGQIMIFASDAPKGIGGYDLYATRHLSGQWTQPVLLSDRINTVGNEMFPTLYRDTLYFSSDHLPGLGGLDLFKTYQRSDNSWYPPQNMMPPVNSGGDDFALTLQPARDQYKNNIMEGYFSSSRPGGMGSDDIYSIRYDPSKEHLVLDNQRKDENKIKEAENILLLEGTVRTPVYAEPGNPNSARMGQEPLDSVRIRIQMGYRDTVMMTGTGGRYRDTIAYDTTYEISVSKEGYLSSSRTIQTRDLPETESGRQTIIADFELDKIYLNREIVLQNIYYDYDKWNIREDAKPTLDSLANILKWNPEIQIQLSSHTDCRGSIEYNRDLSQKRAQSAVDYIISTGIDADRLSARGYGETRPAVDCPCSDCSEEQHQKNRRTTFKVIDQSANE